MGTPNRNWDRWLLASISQHFKVEVADKLSLFMYVEGQHRDTNEQRQWFELRMDGPFAKETSRDYWKIKIEVNCLISTSASDRDYHQHRQNVGDTFSGFHSCISIFKYGNGPDDDQSKLGEAVLRSPNSSIVTSHFGRINPGTQLEQTTIEAHYVMELDT